MRARLLLTSALLLVYACQVPVTTGGKKPPSTKPGSADPVVTAESPQASAAAATPTPAGTSATATPAAIASPSPPDKLRPPSGATSILKGVARLDAAYIVAQGAGNIISGNGSAIISGNASAVVAAGGGSIISGNGSAAIATSSGQIVAQGAGNIISGNGSAIISGNGSAIVAQGGGNIVAQGAGNIVAQGAGNIISGNAGAIVAQGAGNRRLMQTAPSDDARVPVAGMPLGVYSLQTHDPVPVGVDKDGKPVYTVYTNETGGFELYLPKAQEGNVLVVAQVKPDSPDPRLAYGLVARSGGGDEVSLDEDTTVLTTYIRKGLGPFLAQGMLEPDTDKVVARFMEGKGVPCLIREIMAEEYTALRKAAAGVNIDQAPDAEVQDLVQRMVDVLTREMYLGSDPKQGDVITLTKGANNYWQGPDEPAFDAMLDIMHRARDATRAKLKADPSFIDNQKYVQTVNAIRAAENLPPYHITKDTDLNNFVVAEYFMETDPARWAMKGSCYNGAGYLFGMLEQIFKGLGMQDVTTVGTAAHPIPYNRAVLDPTNRFGQSDRADQAYYAILTRSFLMLRDTTPTADGRTVRDKVYGILNAFKPSGKPRVTPTAGPVPMLPCPTPKPTPTPNPKASKNPCA